VATSGELIEAAVPISRSEAFRHIAQRHLGGGYRLARAILGDAHEAEDATHDAFLAAWRKWDTLRDVSRFEPWFDRILVNTCRNRLRTRRRHPVHDLSRELERVGAAGIDRTEDRELVGRALATLNPDQRIVVVLRYYRDLGLDEIAERLDIPPGTVRSRLHYALEALHGAVEPSPAREKRR